MNTTYHFVYLDGDNNGCHLTEESDDYDWAWTLFRSATYADTSLRVILVFSVEPDGSLIVHHLE